MSQSFALASLMQTARRLPLMKAPIFDMHTALCTLSNLPLKQRNNELIVKAPHHSAQKEEIVNKLGAPTQFMPETCRNQTPIKKSSPQVNAGNSQREIVCSLNRTVIALLRGFSSLPSNYATYEFIVKSTCLIQPLRTRTRSFQQKLGESRKSTSEGKDITSIRIFIHEPIQHCNCFKSAAVSPLHHFYIKWLLYCNMKHFH